MQLRICELNEWVKQMDAGTEITPLPAFLGCVQESPEPEHPGCAKPEDTGECVGQGWAGSPEWAAARDHLQLQSDGEHAASWAQLALPHTQGLAILCPTPVKHHFVSASPFAFPVIL